MAAGGVEVYLNNVYSMIERSDLRIDIFIPGKVKSNIYKNSLVSLGCNFIEGNIKSTGRNRYFDIYNVINKILKKEKYDVVHVNTGAITTEAVCLVAAKKNHINIKIAHSHGTVIPGGKIQELTRSLMRRIICSNSDYKLGCSTTANISLFGKKEGQKAIIAKNGIKVEQYKYSNLIRDNIRSEYNWNEKKVIGYVGRLSEEKNPLFLLEVFNGIRKIKDDTILVYFGEGDLRSKLEEKILAYGLKDSVFMYGVKKNINEIMQGLDTLVVPSIREALGIVNVEAQVTNLPCIVSDVVPEEVNVTGAVRFISLKDNIDKWEKLVLQSALLSNRMDRSDDVVAAGYDISHTARIIDDIYHGRPINKHQ